MGKFKKSELKRCPFCGDLPQLKEFNRELSYVSCQNEECPIFDVRIDIEEWQTRSEGPGIFG